MKTLRAIRTALALLFLAASVLFFIAEGKLHCVGAVSQRMQIVPSMLAVSLGAILFWLVLTIFYGRVYCSTVCPTGTLIDLFRPLRRRITRARKTYRYHSPRTLRYHILAVYAVCLVAGLTVVPLVVEPWNIFSNIFCAGGSSAAVQTWTTLGLGAATGVVSGVVSLILLLLLGIFTGRDFCNEFCPIGTALSLVGSRALYHIEIDPDKCTGCLKCEDVCPSGCVKVISRYVDDSRCVRCFDCLKACPDDAIRYQLNRNRPVTPLMKQVKHQGK